MIVKRRWSEKKLEAASLKRRRIERKLDTDLHNGNERLKMVLGAFYLPKDNELKPEGEDAHFICAEEQTIGVADGVGGWAKKGIDAGEYARELMTNSIIAIHNEPKGAVDPKRVLYQAYSNTYAAGSSTACIITLRDNCLYAANVGDSGFMLFRNKELIYKSPVQQHHFNCPFQLGMSRNCGGPSTSAEELEVQVESGDIVVAGTDGLFDNMSEIEIRDVFKQGTIDPELLALTIADLALYNSMDKYSDTPFSIAARRAGKDHKGGKIDDITVIVGHIVLASI